jgi:tetratricopeptide (TPR) repeat protein
MRARTFVIGSGFLFAVATTVPALAQPASGAASYPPACNAASVAQGESERAHTIYQAGKVQYDDKNYDAAIAQFREAYKRDCSKHDLLIIISRAYELKGDKVEALRALEMYLERVPGSPDASTHKNGIESLKRQIAAQPATPVTASTTSAPPPPSTPTEVREHTAPPWVVTGIGVAGVAVGVVILVTTPKLPTGCDATTKACTAVQGEARADFEERQSQAGKSQNQPTVGGVVIGIGAAVTIAGLLWHFLEPTGPVEKTGKTTPKLNPAIAPGFAGVSLGGNF